MKINRRKLFAADLELGEKTCKHCHEKFSNRASEFCSVKCANQHV